MTAKREVSRLYDDVNKAPYTALFNASLSAERMWRAVTVLRRVDEFLKASQPSMEGKERLIAIHGNRLLLHLVFRKLGSSFLDAEAESASDVSCLAQAMLERLTASIAKNFSAAYPASLVKNISKCKMIVNDVLEIGGQ